MITIKLEGLDEVLKDLGKLQKEMPKIAARTLTSLAYDGKKEVEGWLPRLIDRPTPFTMKSMFVFPAEKEDLRAAVGFKGEAGRVSRSQMGSITAHPSMAAQVFGGRRPLKASEKSLLSNGVTNSRKPYLIPSVGAKRDRYGNVTGAFMNKVLYTGVKMGAASQGYHAPLNGRTREASKTGQFFVMRKRFGRDPVGIFKNTGKRKPPIPVFFFASKADYKARIPFERIVMAAVNRNWLKRFNESFDVVAKKYLK
jgi:hypothetical protein